MPQLNPSPWLMVFLLVWTFYMLILFNKALKPLYPNATEVKEMKKTMSPPWTWPW